MAQNHPYWQVSSIGSIFAGGISCGIYLTNSPLTVKYICEHAPLDLLVIQNQRMLDELLQNQPDIKDIVKSFVLMEDHVIDSKCSHKNVLTWQEMLESGKSIENAVLEQREENQAVNHACALSYTSGTTGPPKGKKNLCFHLCLLLFSLLHLFIYCVLLFLFLFLGLVLALSA